ncbi:MAG: RAMP superfamily CRISPR-associated protein [Candidatus Caldarchaeum sp.]|nr:RAMP superfamily CRISPR-associated protein [Candidatus Caldarchaeum sp.]
MQRYQVTRNNPRDRSEFRNLSGVLSITLKTLSTKYGDKTDSYLHVGSGAEQLQTSPNLAVIAKEINNLGLGRLAKTRWREIVGAGEYMAMPVVGGKPVIPGSSVKGNVRARMELSFIPKEGRVRSCLSVGGGMPSFGRHGKIWSKGLEYDRDFKCPPRGRFMVCLMCDIFGTKGLASLLEFSDFVGERVSLQPVSDGYGMKLMAAPPGSAFTGEISFRNLSESELGLVLFRGLAIGDDGVGKPVLLGRLKYRGKLGGKVFGRVKYQLNSLKLSTLSQPLPTLKPGETASGAKLQTVVKTLVDSAKSEFSGEYYLTDEVQPLGMA